MALMGERKEIEQAKVASFSRIFARIFGFSDQCHVARKMQERECVDRGKGETPEHI